MVHMWSEVHHRILEDHLIGKYPLNIKSGGIMMLSEGDIRNGRHRARRPNSFSLYELSEYAPSKTQVRFRLFDSISLIGEKISIERI